MQKQYTPSGSDKQDKAKEILAGLLNLFESGQAPAAITKSVIEARTSDRPAAKWSIGNRMILAIAGTEDARGFNQWKEVGRYVKKGAHAVYILAPNTKVITEKNKDTGEDEKHSIVTGFRYIPVFRVEDTEGKPLPAPADYRPDVMPPLYDVAVAMGINVQWAPTNGSEYGHCTVDGRNIVLRTHEVCTFFHELGHAAHGKIKPLKGGQHADQETVAQMVSETLCQMYGYNQYTGNTWQYVKSYAHGDPVKAIKQILAVLNDIEESINIILDVERQAIKGAA